ncbi:MAG: hypothetical protein GY874_17445 [Desulfobacteraceae bacterium]|nr:hypothetical protein [Desulfobacteraceae bacterium]
MGTSWRQSGRINYHLILGQRYSDSHVQLPMDGYDSWQVEIAWESCLQFMDISKPLTDIPRFEPFRSKDPVTAAYDKANNRPADYWKTMDMEKAKKIYNASRKVASKYPWGATYEQALIMGWQPSGEGAKRTRRESETSKF